MRENMKTTIKRIILAAFAAVAVLAISLPAVAKEDKNTYYYPCIKSSTETTVTVINPLKGDFEDDDQYEYDSQMTIYYAEGGYVDCADKKTLVMSVDKECTTFVVGKLKPGTRYALAFMVGRTNKETGEKDFTRPRHDKMVTLPGKITGLAVSAYKKGRVTFQWNGQKNVNYEYTLVAEDGSDKRTGLFTGKGDGLKDLDSKSFTKLNQNKVYKFRIKASNNINDNKYASDYSNWIYVLPQAEITAAAIKNGKLTVSFDKVKGASGYEVYVSTTNKASKFVKVASVKKNKASVTVKNFKGAKFSNAKTYYVYVAATKKDGKLISRSALQKASVIKKGKLK